MTLLGISGEPRSDSVRTGPREVTLLSGFLGSGKTTLLRSELAQVVGERPAVILNDFSETLIDDVLLNVNGERPVVLSGGCVCCSRREGLALALASLLDDEERGRTPSHNHVVIETSGLSDPGPIAFTIANDPVLKHHYVLGRVCVTVDALMGVRDIERIEIALVQLLAADELLVTKADLVPPEAIEALVLRLHELNPSATISVTASGHLLRREAPRGGSVAAQSLTGPPGHGAGSGGFSTLELLTDEPLDWEAFSIWLSLLLHRHGPDVLRVKAVLDVRGVGPVALNGVQHIVHRPEHLTGAVPPGSRVVLIVRGLDTRLIEHSFNVFVAIK